MIITATEFKTNFGKYLELITQIQEDIFITKNGKTIAKMSNPQISAVDSISGILSGYDIDKSSLREERFLKYESND
ncbi:MAG: type II toxin-antitoxin system Phd/YefM family antitoxin [Ruminococcus sp.]|nr:type II toxin-antitoxin system Phd/YefM family antitoxin [Oscillospiraceae bacterium]MCI7351801.1 type II toxin-antitoxin system Phd/YefM family antitoxin [Ruminococcus sp.]